MKRWLPTILAFVVVTGAAVAGSIKSWTNEVLTAADLNANFSHIHGSMVGGHGARLVNADVSASAAIAHSKLATPALVPKAFAFVTISCSSSPCSVISSSKIDAITRTGTGVYEVDLGYTPANINFAPFVQAVGSNENFCTVTAINHAAAPHVTFKCYRADVGGAATGGAVDTGFSLLVMDEND